MEKIKYCPQCLKENNVLAQKCECGFEFHLKEEEVAVSENTKTKVDNTPLGLWTFVGFICFIAGLILMNKWKEEWPVRCIALKRGIINLCITLGVVALIVVLILILNANGKIV